MPSRLPLSIASLLYAGQTSLIAAIACSPVVLSITTFLGLLLLLPSYHVVAPIVVLGIAITLLCVGAHHAPKVCAWFLLRRLPASHPVVDALQAPTHNRRDAQPTTPGLLGNQATTIVTTVWLAFEDGYHDDIATLDLDRCLIGNDSVLLYHNHVRTGQNALLFRAETIQKPDDQNRFFARVHHHLRDSLFQAVRHEHGLIAAIATSTLSFDVALVAPTAHARVAHAARQGNPTPTYPRAS